MVTQRHRRWVIAAWATAGVLVIGGWAGMCVLRLVQADSSLREGVGLVRTIKAEVNTQSLADGGPSADLGRARAAFGRAHGEVASVWVEPLRVLPFLGRQVRSLNALSGAAAQVTSDGQQTLTEVHGLLSAPHETAAERAGLVGRLAGALNTLSQRLGKVDLGPSNALLSTLATKRATFASDLTKLRGGLVQATAGAQALSRLLTGPATYLILTANNAEMRDGSGMFLEVGTVTSSDGSLRLGHLVSTENLYMPRPLVPLTGDLAARWGQEEPNQEWRNLALSPQFDANAALAAQMWRAQTGQRVDGVLAVDVAALQDLLEVTGPVTSGATTVDSSDVSDYLLMAQYVGDTGDPAQNVARHEAIGRLASETFSALERPGLSLSRLATEAAAAVDGRHILAWSADPSIEAEWLAAGAGGRLGPDDLLLGLINQGANKLDPYQQVMATLDISPAGGDTAVDVRVTVTNDAPSGLWPYVAEGISPPRTVGLYSGTLALDFPLAAGDVLADGGGPAVSAGPDETSDVLAVQVSVPQGASETVTWHLVFAGLHGVLRIDPSARMPPSEWNVEGRSFSDSTAHIVTW